MTSDELKKRIRRLTKRISTAKQNQDLGEVSNLRTQRANFAKQLADEHEEYFFISEGKSTFGSMEEMQEHYQDPANLRKVQGAVSVEQLIEARRSIASKLHQIDGMEPTKAKELILKELREEQTKVEKMANKINKEIDEPEIDFSKLEDDDDDLEGIDTDL